jgi:hypothetical protein
MNTQQTIRERVEAAHLAWADASHKKLKTYMLSAELAGAREMARAELAQARGWRNGTVLRATPYEVEEWIRAKFSRTATWKSRYMHHFVNAVIEETHRYARGIPVLADGAS